MKVEGLRDKLNEKTLECDRLNIDLFEMHKEKDKYMKKYKDCKREFKIYKDQAEWKENQWEIDEL